MRSVVPGFGRERRRWRAGRLRLSGAVGCIIAPQVRVGDQPGNPGFTSRAFSVQYPVYLGPTGLQQAKIERQQAW